MVVQAAPQPEADDRPMMTDEAGAFCRLSRAYMVRLRQRGTGPKFVRVGTRILYFKDDLKDWLRSHRVSK